MDPPSDPTRIDEIDLNTTLLDMNQTDFQRMFDNLNATLSENYVWWALAAKSLIIFVYCLLITVSLIGNCLVIRVLLCVKFRSASSSGTITSSSKTGNGGTLMQTSRSHRLHIHTGTGTSKLL